MGREFLGRKTRVQYIQTDTETTFASTDVGEGTTVFDRLVAHRSGDDVRFYDRICDHNGGSLITTPRDPNLLRCPLHDWVFDPGNGHYTNVNKTKEPLTHTRVDDKYLVRSTKRALKWLKSSGEGVVKFTFLNHACFVIDIDGKLSFATDPWVLGSAFCDGWWLSEASPVDAIDRLKACDFIYISHNHPDHLHAETLQKLHPDTRFVVPRFTNRSVSRYLNYLGFEEVYECDFGDVFDFGIPGFNFTVLKSGDFRDDSGVVFSYGDFVAVLTVDCNALNHYVLPQNVTLLATSFAGGASGFPLCFDNYDEAEKARITARNRSAVSQSVNNYIDATSPTFYVPYAGYFKEDPDRDGYVASRNKKNSANEIGRLVAKRGINFINPVESRTFIFCGGDLVDNTVIPLVSLECNYSDWYDRSARAYAGVSDDEIASYFRGAQFTDHLILYLNLCDSEFESLGRTFEVDFRGDRVLLSRVGRCPTFEDICLEDGIRRIILDVRVAAFGRIVRDFLPWEDFMIGFQARLRRWPNVYNSRMWYYFTNEYIADFARKAAFDCGQSCARLGQEAF